ncbi:hypothetical protein AOPFMNJM_4305 [Methylobacterium jeotgali]|uniref:Uncharacterized protein n=1 Tax=Methylobacterium jeotgali TaxID=381630 RepID=A0ABQ4T0N1_9HYPH|nr:hypothetical protein AOPFMNJM_4305 [Methylobacterium jeotgali]
MHPHLAGLVGTQALGDRPEVGPEGLLREAVADDVGAELHRPGICVAPNAGPRPGDGDVEAEQVALLQPGETLGTDGQDAEELGLDGAPQPAGMRAQARRRDRLALGPGLRLAGGPARVALLAVQRGLGAGEREHSVRERVEVVALHVLPALGPQEADALAALLVRAAGDAVDAGHVADGPVEVHAGPDGGVGGGLGLHALDVGSAGLDGLAPQAADEAAHAGLDAGLEGAAGQPHAPQAAAREQDVGGPRDPGGIHAGEQDAGDLMGRHPVEGRARGDLAVRPHQGIHAREGVGAAALVVALERDVGGGVRGRVLDELARAEMNALGELAVDDDRGVAAGVGGVEGAEVGELGLEGGALLLLAQQRLDVGPVHEDGRGRRDGVGLARGEWHRALLGVAGHHTREPAQCGSRRVLSQAWRFGPEGPRLTPRNLPARDPQTRPARPRGSPPRHAARTGR